MLILQVKGYRKRETKEEEMCTAKTCGGSQFADI